MTPMELGSLPARMDGLEAQLKLPDELLNPHQTPIRVAVSQTLTPFPLVIREGAERLREIVRGLLAGQTPEALGLIYESRDAPELLERVWEGFRSVHPAYDIDAISQLTGHNRAWVRVHLLFRLGQRDIRAARAIEALGWNDMKPQMEDAYEELKHLSRLRGELREILSRMG